MSNQIARLFARGSLLNKTAKSLTEQQVKQVESLMYLAWSDNEIAKHRYEFCAALGRTIGGEYKPSQGKKGEDDKHLSAAMADLWFVFWRVSVDVLFHHPKLSVVTDKISRRKYFKTHIMNYLRQVLNENKPAIHKERITLQRPGNIMARDVIKSILDNGAHKSINYTMDDSDLKNIKFTSDFWLLQDKMIRKIWNAAKMADQWGVEIKVGNSEIEIISKELPTTSEYKITTANRIKFVSDGQASDDDDIIPQLEFAAQKAQESIDAVDQCTLQDLTETLMGRLDDQERAVLQILHNPPKAFTDKYCPSDRQDFIPRDNQIAEWFNITKNKVTEIRNNIKKQAMALDIQPV